MFQLLSVTSTDSCQLAVPSSFFWIKLLLMIHVLYIATGQDGRQKDWDCPQSATSKQVHVPLDQLAIFLPYLCLVGYKKVEAFKNPVKESLEKY